jgi:tRNA (cytidine/uridine-2'-O-)-methyltransferase
MLQIALYQPEIPQNTGNIIRLCANSSAQLHLIEPMGFTMEDKRMIRAGLDYHEFASIKRHADYQQFLTTMSSSRIFACTTKSKQLYTEVDYQESDIFLFGPETRGLPAEIITSLPSIRLPMVPTSRSLNLSNAVAIILYEGWRQLGFVGGR